MTIDPRIPDALPGWPRERTSADAARLSRIIGDALRVPVDGAGPASWIEVLMPLGHSSNALEEALAGRANCAMLECREGPLVLGRGGVAVLCLLGGVPLPAGDNAAKERLRASVAVARLPEPLASLHLSLAAARGMAYARKTALVRQRLHARCEDVSLYCDAWAPAAVWDAIVGRGVRRQGERVVPIADLVLRLAFQLGRAQITAGGLQQWRLGDVVRMPCWMDTGGTGAVRIAGRRVAVRCLPGSALRRFEVLSVDPFPAPGSADPVPDFVLHERTRASRPPRPPRPPRPFAMNTHLAPMNPSSPEKSDVASGNDLTERLDAIAVSLVAEVGTLRLSVGAIRSLAPGMTFEIETHGDSEVMLCTEDGRHLAEGRLVDIDGQVGIQIVRLVAA